MQAWAQHNREARCRWNRTFSVQLGVSEQGRWRFVGRTACLETKRHQRAIIWVTTQICDPGFEWRSLKEDETQAGFPMDTWTSDEKGGMQATCPGGPTWERSVERPKKEHAPDRERATAPSTTAHGRDGHVREDDRGLPVPCEISDAREAIVRTSVCVCPA